MQQLATAEQCSTADGDRSRERLQAGSARSSSLCPLPTTPATPTISPRTRERGDRREPGTREVVDDEVRLVRRSPCAWRETSTRAVRPTISASSSESVMSLDPRGAADPAVAQDGHTVGELPDLAEPVGDVDDRGAGGDDLAHPAEEQRDGVASERCGRLVEDEQRGSDRERLGDLEQVLLGERQRLDPVPEVDLAGRRRRAARGPPCWSAVRRRPTAAARPGGSPGRSCRGARAGCWCTIAIPRAAAERGVRPVTSSPCTRIVPASGWTVPARCSSAWTCRRRSRPRIAWTSPGSTSTDTSVSAATPA